jgi:hypothetical protein
MDKVYVVTEQSNGFSSYYKSFDKAKSRAEWMFDGFKGDRWTEITEGRYGYWCGVVDGEFETIWVSEKSVY